MIQEPAITTKDRRLAITSQALYLTNLSIFPILSFIILIVLYFKYRNRCHSYALLHFRQSIMASVVSGILLIIVSVLILLLGGLQSPYTWMFLIVYFVSIHAALILYGVFAFIKAIALEKYTYPLLGGWWK